MKKLANPELYMREVPRMIWIFLVLVLLAGTDGNAAETRAENDTHQPVFSYLLGIQQPHAVEPGLAVHEGVPSQLWCADHIVNSMGGDILKLTMSRKYLKMQNIDPQGAEYLVEFAKHPFYRKILNLPYRVIYFWAHGRKFNAFDEEELYKEFYDFTVHLLKEYNNSGKTFMISNWEGDWLLLGEGKNQNNDAPPEKIKKMISWANIRGKAIEDAKKTTPHTNVNVYFCLEVNRVEDARIKGLKRMIDGVVPYAKYMDYISLSSYDIQNFHNWKVKCKDNDEFVERLGSYLDYVQAHLPERDVAGSRIIIGEAGIPVAHIRNHYKCSEAEAEKIRARLTMENVLFNLEWGVEAYLWWALHNNEKTADGSYKGFGLIDQESGHRRETCYMFEKYFKFAREYTEAYEQSHHRLPSQDEMRAEAIQWLKGQIELDSANIIQN
jgi:hypothetical protein